MINKILLLLLLSNLLFSNDSPKNILCKYLLMINNYNFESYRYISRLDQSVIPYHSFKSIMRDLKSNVSSEFFDPNNTFDIIKNNYNFKRPSPNYKIEYLSESKVKINVSFFFINKKKYFQDRVDISFLKGPLADYPSEKIIFKKLIDKYNIIGAPVKEIRKEFYLVREFDEWKVFLNLKNKKDILKTIKGDGYENRRFIKKNIERFCE